MTRPSSLPAAQVPTGRASRPATPTRRRSEAEAGQLALRALHRRGRPRVAHAQPRQGQDGEHRALQPQRLGSADPEQDDQGQEGQRREQRQRCGQQRATGADQAEHGAEQSRDEPHQPRQHQQPGLAVDRWQRGQQVLPAVQRLVHEQPPALGAGRGEVLGAQAEHRAEQEVPGSHAQRGHHARPAQHHRDAEGGQHGEQRTRHADPPELGLGVRRPEADQRGAGQREHEQGVHHDRARLAQRQPAQEPHRHRTTSAGRPGRPCRRPGSPRGRRSR